MIDAKNNVYLSNLSLLGAIVLLIGLFTPAGFFSHEDVLGLAMLPGFILAFGSDWSSFFPPVLPQFMALINGIFLCLILVICCFIIFSTSLKFKRGTIDFQHYRTICLNNAFILIIDAILWILLVTLSFNLYGLNFWGIFSVGFGIIAPFITAILIFIEFFINRYKVAREKKKYKYNLPISSLGGFVFVVITWLSFSSVQIETIINYEIVLLITNYFLIVALITFIGIFSIYYNLRQGYIILIIALIISIFYLPLLSTIIPARKEYLKTHDQS